jgi:hypothetical protein
MVLNLWGKKTGLNPDGVVWFIVAEPTPVRGGLDVSPAGTDKASGVDRSDNGPISSNNQSRLLNTPRIFLFSKREFEMASSQTKPFPGEDHATAAGSPQSRWQPVFQFP